MMKCCFCDQSIVDGVICNGNAFCSVENAEEFRKEMADSRARNEGFFDYEDMMEHFGAAIIG